MKMRVKNACLMRHFTGLFLPSNLMCFTSNNLGIGVVEPERCT